MRFLPALAALLLAGCSIAREATLPDGSKGYVISHCPDLSYCYNRAADLCHGKYDVLTHSEVGVGFGDTASEISVKCQ